MFKNLARSTSLVLGMLSLAAACADPVSPNLAPDVEGPAYAVGQADQSGTGVDLTLFSSSATQSCGYSATMGTLTPCGITAVNSNEVTKHPEWGSVLSVDPTGVARWISRDACGSSETCSLPGAYTYETTFSVPAGSTDRSLNVRLLVDNNVAVYLNGNLLGSNAGTAESNHNGSPLLLYSATASDFVDGTNRLTFVVNNEFKARDVNGLCGVPEGSTAATYNQTVCRNPTGLLYAVTVGWTPAATGNQGCSLGFWKNKGAKSGLYNTAQKVNTVFNFAGTSYVAQGNQTFLQALGNGGGGIDALLRQAVAAYLNAQSASVDYPLTTAQVQAMVNGALNGSMNMNTVAQQLDAYNNLHGASICRD